MGASKLIAIRTTVLKEMLESPEWTQKLEKARNFEEVEKVLEGFCKAKGKVAKKL